MLQLLGLGAPLVEFGARFVVWLYMPALLCFLVSLSFFKESCRTLVLRTDLDRQTRLKFASHQAVQGLIGCLVTPAVFLAIYFRKELFQCLIGLF